MHAEHPIRLDHDLLSRIEEIARTEGITPAQLIHEAIERFAAASQDNGHEGAGNLFERASEAGLVGCLSGLPADLSTNKSHMEGFGRGQG